MDVKLLVEKAEEKKNSNLRVWVLGFEKTWYSYRPQFGKYLVGLGVPDVRDAEVWVEGRQMNVRMEG